MKIEKDKIWSISTTLREAERIIGFAKVAYLLDGKVWNRETQTEFQILLIQHRKYLNYENAQTYNGLSLDEINLLKNKSIEITYQQAEGIFNSKNYQDPPMRGRQSINPLKKFGLFTIKDGILKATNLYHLLINDEISIEQFMLDNLLKYQLPNPIEKGYKNWNTKRF